MKSKLNSLILPEGLARTALESVNTGITISDATDPNLPLIYVNKYFENMTGYTLEEIKGKNCRFLQGDLTDQDSLQYLRQALKNNEPCKIRLKNFRKNGSMFWNELNLSPIFNQTGDIEYYIGVQKNITDEMQYQDELIKLTERDSLTLLLNTHAFYEYTSRLMKISLRTGQPFGVGVVDINNFKAINDRHGHMIGDEILQAMARRLMKEFRGNDAVGRLGGDEFMISCISNSLEAEWFYQKIKTVAESITHDYNLEETFSVSVGYTTCELKRDTDIKELVRLADEIMRVAKEKFHG